MKRSPHETTLSLFFFFWKGPVHLLGVVIVGAEMGRESRALPFAFECLCRSKRSRRVPPAGQTIKSIAPEKGLGKVFVCRSVVLPLRGRERLPAQANSFASHTQQQSQLGIGFCNVFSCNDFLLRLAA